MTAAQVESFDYIVVGAGSAGSVIASRLGEDPRTTVLVLEAGPSERILRTQAPGAFVPLIGTRRTWMYETEPEPAAAGRRLMVPQGRMPGGGSSINGMIYIRGQREDFDGWRDAGCDGWGFDDVLPYFVRAEGNDRLSDRYHGTEGPLQVTDVPNHHPLSAAFVRAGQEIGLSYNHDFNGARQDGVGYFQVNQHRGERASTARTYLRPALRRGNIELVLSVEVDRVTIRGRRATGVAYRRGGRLHTVAARRGVILTAGTLATPKLLMLSGVGPVGHLREHGIDVVVDSPGVGANFQDHLQVFNYYSTREPISLLGQDRGLPMLWHGLAWALFRAGLVTSNVGESCCFADLDGDGRADVQIHAFPVLVGDVGREPPPGHGITISPCDLRPKSRGIVRLRSADPRDPILFNANALSAEEDVASLVRGLRLSRGIARAPSLSRLIDRELLLDGEQTDEQLAEYVRRYAKTVFHPVGTCRMGSDQLAVVDPALAVRGLDCLYVGDASVMPSIVSGNTNAAAIMIGERCADLVRDQEKLRE